MRCLPPPKPSIRMDFPIRMSRAQVTDLTASSQLADLYDHDISYGSVTLDVPRGHDVFVEFWAMESHTYSCNGGAAQTPDPGAFYAYGTCTLTNVTEPQTVTLSSP
jgi:hypothetical protein